MCSPEDDDTRFHIDDVKLHAEHSLRGLWSWPIRVRQSLFG